MFLSYKLIIQSNTSSAYLMRHAVNASKKVHLVKKFPAASSHNHRFSLDVFSTDHIVAQNAGAITAHNQYHMIPSSSIPQLR